MPQKILVKGPALSRSGYGEQTRFALEALRTREDLFEVYIVNIPWGQTGHITEDTEENNWIRETIVKTLHAIGEKTQFDISLQVTIPPEFEKIAPVNIGYTAGIETTKVSPQWLVTSNNVVDKILTISQHSRKTFENTTCNIQNNETGQVLENYRLNKPIEVVSYPVREVEPEPLDIEFSTTKNFLAIAQWGPRKNLEATIAGFISEFKDDPDVGLVLKTNLTCDSIYDRSRTHQRLTDFLRAINVPDRKCKIHLLHGEVSTANLTWLYQHPTMKALINIAHGEGFGLPLFEAAYNGLPLVTITWGGQLDFLTKENKKGKAVPRCARVDFDLGVVRDEHVWEGVIEKDAMWAYAKEASYRRALREILTKEKHYKKEATVLQNHLKKKFAKEEMLANFVSQIYEEPDAQVQEWLAKLAEMEDM